VGEGMSQKRAHKYRMLGRQSRISFSCRFLH